MKIKYTCKEDPNATDWSKVKVGDRVVLWEGWNIPEDEKRTGLERVVTKVDFDYVHAKNSQNCPLMEVQYGDDPYVSYVYPLNLQNEKRVVRGIILK